MNEAHDNSSHDPTPDKDHEKHQEENGSGEVTRGASGMNSGNGDDRHPTPRPPPTSRPAYRSPAPPSRTPDALFPPWTASATRRPGRPRSSSNTAS